MQRYKNMPAHSATDLWHDDTPKGKKSKLPPDVIRRMMTYNHAKHGSQPRAYCIACKVCFIMGYLTWVGRALSQGFYCRDCK